MEVMLYIWSTLELHEVLGVRVCCTTFAIKDVSLVFSSIESAI
jgi:hypothetical protein